MIMPKINITLAANSAANEETSHNSCRNSILKEMLPTGGDVFEEIIDVIGEFIIESLLH